MAYRQGRPRRKKDPAALAALEATPLEPKPVAEILEQCPTVATILASRAAKATSDFEPDQSHAQQLGPRKRHPQRARERVHERPWQVQALSAWPVPQVQVRRQALPRGEGQAQRSRVLYVPAEKAWSAQASWQIREASDKLAIEFDGKDISYGRGA